VERMESETEGREDDRGHGGWILCGMMVEWWDLDEVDDRVEWRRVSMRPDPPPP
jgi:hypothetical protein